MQLQLADNQYVTLRGNNLARHEEIAKAAYASAKARFKFKPDEVSNLHLVDDDSGIHVTITIGSESHTAVRKADKWFWQVNKEDDQS